MSCSAILQLERPATCEEVLGGNHINLYWDNEHFLCRTSERPCEVWPDIPQVPIKLSDDYYLKLTDGDDITWPSLNEGPAEVWMVRADRNGTPKHYPWNSDHRFYSEGGWKDGPEYSRGGIDFNDFRFGSLDCNRGKWDNYDFFFIIIDGIVVDSCRACTAYNTTGGVYYILLSCWSTQRLA